MHQIAPQAASAAICISILTLFFPVTATADFHATVATTYATSNTWQTVNWGTLSPNSDTNLDLTTDTYYPPHDGWYTFSASVWIQYLTDGTVAQIALYTNGVRAARNWQYAKNSYTVVPLTVSRIYLTTNTTVQIKAYHNESPTEQIRSIEATFFCGGPINGEVDMDSSILLAAVNSGIWAILAALICFALFWNLK